MRENSTAQRVRDYAERYFIDPARRRNESTVQIVAGDIHKALHLENLVPTVCQALKGRRFLKENQLTIEHSEGPPSGLGPKLKITYRLNAGQDDAARASEDLPLLRLLGIGKEVFKSLGGAEAFIRSERENFYGSGKEK